MQNTTTTRTEVITQLVRELTDAVGAHTLATHNFAHHEGTSYAEVLKRAGAAREARLALLAALTEDN